MPFDRELSGDHHILWLEKDRFYRRYIAVTNLEADISTGPEKAIPACHKMWRCAPSIRVFESQTFWHYSELLNLFTIKMISEILNRARVFSI